MNTARTATRPDLRRHLRTAHAQDLDDIARHWTDAARVLVVLTVRAVTTQCPCVEMTSAEILRALGAEPGARAGRHGSSGVWTRTQCDGIDGAIATLAMADLVRVVRAAETMYDRWTVEIVQ